MPQTKLILTLPQGTITATSLSVSEFAHHRSPGSGKYFDGRAMHVDLKVSDGKPGFEYLPEGGWRDSAGDTAAALTAAAQGRRTKTALSNMAFSCTPLNAWDQLHLAKSCGELLPMTEARSVGKFEKHDCSEGMSADEVAAAIGQKSPLNRVARLYMTFCPIEMLAFSILTPAEYVWYATHRPGKKFRAVAFTEVREDPGLRIAALSVFERARHELQESNGKKKTKTVVFGDCFNRVPFNSWVGYDDDAVGGIYVGNENGAQLWSFPETIPRSWARAY